jgi:serine/threonine-protein kinase
MSSDTRIGRTIAGYRIEAVLGHGGMSVVYRAEQVSLGRTVALKVIASGLASDESYRRRFEREARQAAEIDHPNIIPVYDAGEAEDHLYIAMRFIQGRDLGSLIAEDGPLGMGRTLFVLEQAAAALDAAHERGLVHRDVKPPNILIEEGSERVFVSDFGVAKRTAAPGLTRTGLFLGTVAYAAPEQIEGREVDARTDVYALGCVFYECLTGRSPYRRDNEIAEMHAHLAEAPPSLSSARSGLTEALDGVIATALAKSKDERYSTCGELLEAARVGAVGSSPAAPRRLAVRLRRKWGRLAAVMLAVAAAGVAVGVTALATGQGGGTPISKYIPEELLAACKGAPVYASAQATVVCSPPKGDAYFPDEVKVSLFPKDSLYAAYSLEAGAHGFDTPNEVGACDARRWKGQGSWIHGPNTPGGARFCYLENGAAVLYWTHEEAGEPDHENVLGVARAADGDRAKLLAWWNYWRHRIGRVSY